MRKTELLQILNSKGLEGFLGDAKLTEEITSIIRSSLACEAVVEQRKEKISERLQRCPEGLLETLKEYSVDIIVKSKDDNDDFLVPGFYAVNCPNIRMFARGSLFETLRYINPTFIEHQFMFDRNTRVKVFQDHPKEVDTEYLLGRNILILGKDLNYTLYTFEKIIEAHEDSGGGLRSIEKE